MEVDAGEKTLHLKRFSQHPPSGARFSKKRENVNMACRKGTARPQPCVTVFTFQFYLQETAEQQMFVERFSRGICLYRSASPEIDCG